MCLSSQLAHFLASVWTIWIQGPGTGRPRGHLRVDRDGLVLPDAVPGFAVPDITAADLQGFGEHPRDSDMGPARDWLLPSQGGWEHPSAGQLVSSSPKVALAFSPKCP